MRPYRFYQGLANAPITLRTDGRQPVTRLAAPAQQSVGLKIEAVKTP
jgi:hypothetical protein